jgi:hypothetical protein
MAFVAGWFMQSWITLKQKAISSITTAPSSGPLFDYLVTADMVIMIHENNMGVFVFLLIFYFQWHLLFLD